MSDRYWRLSINQSKRSDCHSPRTSQKRTKQMRFRNEWRRATFSRAAPSRTKWVTALSAMLPLPLTVADRGTTTARRFVRFRNVCKARSAGGVAKRFAMMRRQCCRTLDVSYMQGRLHYSHMESVSLAFHAWTVSVSTQIWTCWKFVCVLTWFAKTLSVGGKILWCSCIRMITWRHVLMFYYWNKYSGRLYYL